MAVLFLCSGDCGCVRDYGCLRCLLGVPLLPLYMRGAGLQGRFPSRLRVGILAGYNCISRLYKEDRILSLFRWKLPVVLRSEQS